MPCCKDYLIKACKHVPIWSNCVHQRQTAVVRCVKPWEWCPNSARPPILSAEPSGGRLALANKCWCHPVSAILSLGQPGSRSGKVFRTPEDWTNLRSMGIDRRYVSTIFLAICCGDNPLDSPSIGLKKMVATSNTSVPFQWPLLRYR